MDHHAILQSIAGHLCGDPARDLAFLHEQSIRYASDPELISVIDQLIRERSPELVLLDAARRQACNLRHYQEAMAHVRGGDMAGAQSILSALLPPPSAPTAEYDFNNPLEEMWLRATMPPHSYMRSSERYLECCQLYAYVLVERRQYAAALDALDWAQRRNPVCLAPRFERADLYKRMHLTDDLLTAAHECFERAYMPAHLARCYRMFGFCFAERQQYEFALACLMRSLRWEENPKALQELLFVGLRSGMHIDRKRWQRETPRLLQEAGVPSEPHPLWIEIALSLGRRLSQHPNRGLALPYFQLAYQLRHDVGTLREIQKLSHT